MDLNLPSSKVAVEYFDPSGVYQLVEKQLKQRLPLRDLRWSSDRRGEAPRSITSLHVDLIPHEQNRSSTEAQPNDGAKARERRHQIPGLRPTPYLKLYLLRCDDNDAYKKAKRLLKDWLKENGQPGDGPPASAESHDAFRCLIVHVVLANTAAALQPRFSGGSGSGSNERAPSSTRWPGMGSSTLYEKLRSDFKRDMVAQIRIPLSEMGPHIPPASMSGSVGGALHESPQEQRLAWDELADMLKSNILQSFDARVTQYEEDIAEKDSQRGLPGWNFCTFFVLKEGLAIAFESVGLLGDALQKYDELDLGLDGVIRDQEMSSETASSTSFLPCTPFLVEHLSKTSSPPDNSRTTRGTFNEVIGAGSKAYRDLILANQVSVYDFRCYLFSRQLSLLLRLANVSENRVDKRKPAVPEDLTILADVCQRSLEFVTSVSRILRVDLDTSFELRQDAKRKLPAVLSEVSPAAWPATCEDAVSAWIFSISQDILHKTRSRHIPISSTIQLPSRKAERPRSVSSESGIEQKVSIPELKAKGDTDRPTRPAEITSPLMFSGVEEHLEQAEDGGGGLFSRTGLQELCSRRAELYLLGRDVLAKLAQSHGWLKSHPWLASVTQPVDSFENVDLDEPPAESTQHWQLNIPGTGNPLYDSAVIDEDMLLIVYEALTEKAYWHYVTAKPDHHSESRSAEKTKAEQAILRYYRGDYVFAAKCFEELRATFASTGWSTLESTMLDMYVECLWKMGRKEEYAAKALDLLCNIASKSRQSLRSEKNALPATVLSKDESAIEGKGYLSRVLHVAKDLDIDLQFPMNRLFSEITVNTFLRPYEEHDGFQLQLCLTYLLHEKFTADQIRIRLVDAVDGVKRHIWLESTDAVDLSYGRSKVWVGSKVTMPGTYFVDAISLRAQKLVFFHHATTQNQPFGGNQMTPRLQDDILICYSSPDELSAKLSMHREQTAGGVKAFQLLLNTGRNNVSSVEIRLKAASAGLRLRTADTRITDKQVQLDVSDPSVLSLSAVQSHKDVRLLIPFSVEQELPELKVKLDISYTTEHGDFELSHFCSVKMALPVKIEVQDLFRGSSYFPRLSVFPAADSVLRIMSYRLEGSPGLTVSSPQGPTCPMIVYSPSAAPFIYRIIHAKEKPIASYSLDFELQFHNVDEEILHQERQNLETKLEDDNLKRYINLVWPIYEMQILQRLAQDREQIILREMLVKEPFDIHDWREVLLATEPTSRSYLEKSIRDWYNTYQIVQLEQTTTLPSYKLRLKFDIPTAPAVFDVDLRLQSVGTKSHVMTQTQAVEEMIPAELHIKYSSTWSREAAKPMECAFEIVANPDLWIIGGQRQGRFMAKEGEATRFPLQLVPLQSGYQRLPIVHAWAVELSGSDGHPQEQAAAGRTLFASRASHDTLRPGVTPAPRSSPPHSGSSTTGESVLILPNVSSITAKTDPAGGGSTLLESQRRAAGFVGP